MSNTYPNPRGGTAGGSTTATTYVPGRSGAPQPNQSLQDYARVVAAQRGVPEDILIGLLTAENNWRSEGGNGGGIGQFLATTARDYGTTQAELRKNPKKAIDLAAKYLADNARPYTNDPQQWEKAAASYFVGPGTIAVASRSGKNWLEAADALAEQYKQGSVTEYLQKTKVLSREGLMRAGEGFSKQATTTRPSTPAVNRPPDINDPQYNTTDENGNPFRDVATWSADLKAYYEGKEAERKFKSGADAQFIDDLINDMGMEIEAGRLSVQAASDVLRTRVDSYKNATDFYNSEAFKYGAPVGATEVPMGDYTRKELGIGPQKITGGITINPLQEAMNATRQAEQYKSQVPGAKSISSIRQGIEAKNVAQAVQDLLTSAGIQMQGTPPAPFSGLRPELNPAASALDRVSNTYGSMF